MGRLQSEKVQVEESKLREVQRKIAGEHRNLRREVQGDMVTWEHVHEAYSASTQVRQTSLVNREQL